MDGTARLMNYGYASMGYRGDGVDMADPTAPRTWFYFNEFGKMKTVQMDKYSVATRLQIPLRDMRVLDPLFPTPYPSAIFIRDHSIILNLEHIKLIACSDQVWLLDSPHSKSGHFSDDYSFASVERLKKALSVALRIEKEDAQHYVSCHASFQDMQEEIYNKYAERISDEEQWADAKEVKAQLLSVDLKLPFELRAVESALHEFTRHLAEELQDIEAEAGDALNNLSRRVCRTSLERVRGAKSALNGLYARVIRTREELERILDDDEDMFNMYLGDDLAGGGASPHVGRTPVAVPEHSVESLNINSPRFDLGRKAGGRKKNRHKSKASKYASILSRKSGAPVPFYEVWQEKEVDEVEAVEAFLEVYFMKADFLMKRLRVLKDKIDDTEVLINIDLDFRRNELFKVDILLTSGTMATGLVSAIAGIFGMNLQSGGEPEVNDRSHQIFVLVAVIASVGAAFIFTALVAWMRHKKIMFVPEPNVDEMLKLSSSIKRSSFKFN